MAGAAGLVWQVKAEGRANRRLQLQQAIDALESTGMLLTYARLCIARALRLTMQGGPLLAQYLSSTVHLDQLPYVKAALDATAVGDVPGAWEKLAFLAGRDAFSAALGNITDMQRALAQDHANLEDQAQLHFWRGQLTKHSAELGVRSDVLRKRVDQLNAAKRGAFVPPRW
jgi:hypothetical protein